MRAVSFARHGDSDVLEVAVTERPQAGPGEALVRIRAAGVNPADTKWRAGLFAAFAPVEFPHIPGYDIAGEIISSTRFVPGTRVVAMLDPFRKGGYAEFAVVDEAALAPIPETLAFAVAASIPTAGLTGLQLVEDVLDVQAGDQVLISGATGAVGRIAIWAARQRGARVIAAVRIDRAALARSLGAQEIWPLPALGGRARAADHFIDTIGGTEAARLGTCIAAGGGFVTVATTPIPSDGLAVEPIFHAVRPDAVQLERLAAAVAAGDVAPPPLQEIGFDAVRTAHRRIEEGGFGGKFILVP